MTSSRIRPAASCSWRSRWSSTSARPAKIRPGSWSPRPSWSAARPVRAASWSARESSPPLAATNAAIPGTRTSSATRPPVGCAKACSTTAPAASSSPAWMWAPAVAAWRRDSRPRLGGRPPTASSARCRWRSASRGSPAVLMMLAPRALDQGGQLAVGVRVRPANAVEPRRCIVGPVQRDQPDQELHHPGRVGLDERCAELVEPQAQRSGRDVGALRHAHRAIERSTEDPPGALDVAHRDGVRQRALDISAVLEHPARPIVRRLEAGGAERGQPCPQEGPEQVVVAVPAGLVVQRHHEQVGGQQAVEQVRSLGAARDVHAQPRVEGVEHRRLDEEVDELGRQAGENLAHQEVADGSIRAGERVEEVAVSGAPLQRDRRQLRSGGPALGELVQPMQLVARQRHVVQREEVGHLRGGEPEVVAAQLDQLATQPQPGQRQGRIRPGTGHEADRVGQRVEERRHQRRIGGRQVEIVHDDHPRRVERGEPVRRRDRGVVGRRAGPFQHRERIVGDTGPPRRDRRQQGTDEARRLGVRRIARQPRHPVAVRGCPRRDDRRLPVTGRRRHERQPVVAIEAGGQLGARHQRAT